MSFVRQSIVIIRTSIIVLAMALFIASGPIALAEETAQPPDSATTEQVVEQPIELPLVQTESPQDSTTQPVTEDLSLQNTPQDPSPVDTANITLESNNTTTNTADQNATTGDATVASNDDISGTATGNASNAADVLNVTNNYQDLAGAATSPTIYTLTVNGDQNGDITIDPSLLGAISLSEAPLNSIPYAFDLNSITVIASNLIDNNIAQNSASGNADVINNDNVGDITTGDANNSIDIINIASTVIGTGGNFIGIINVFGDFQGNVILPASILNSLVSQPAYSNTAVSITNNTDIANNATMNANSGAANVTENDNVNGVTTGNSTNNLLVKNYVGQYVFTQNAFLIIVSVGGNWYGMLLGLPQATTSVLSSDNPENSNLLSLSSEPASLLDINVITNTAINNALLMNATSGNANVSGNDNVGSVKTGNATNNARIINISNTVVSLAQWFGVLYINILGNWNGGVALTPFSIDPETLPVQTSNTGNNAATTNNVSAVSPIAATRFNRFRGFAYASPALENISPTSTEALGTEVIRKFSSSEDVFKQQSSSMYWLALIGIFGASAIGANQAYKLRIR